MRACLKETQIINISEAVTYILHRRDSGSEMKGRHEFISLRWHWPQHERSALSVSFSTFWKTCIYVICCQSETVIYTLQAATAKPLVSMSMEADEELNALLSLPCCFFLSLCHLILSLHPLPMSSWWQLPCFLATRHVSLLWKNQELWLLTGKVPAIRLQGQRPSSCSRQWVAAICSVMPSGCKSLCCTTFSREGGSHNNCQCVPCLLLARTWMRSS